MKSVKQFAWLTTKKTPEREVCPDQWLSNRRTARLLKRHCSVHRFDVITHPILHEYAKQLKQIFEFPKEQPASCFGYGNGWNHRYSQLKAYFTKVLLQKEIEAQHGYIGCKNRVDNGN